MKTFLAIAAVVVVVLAGSSERVADAIIKILGG